MASNSVHVNLAFTADTSKAKAQIQDLQHALSALTTNSINKNSPFAGISEELSDATAAAAQLETQLKNCVNVNTGKLDLTKFMQSLNASGTTLNEYANKLNALGPAGQQAFSKLAAAINSADAPLRQSSALLHDFANTLKNTVKWQISSSMIHGFMGALSSAYGYAQDLNASLNDIRIVTGQTVDQMDAFAQRANKAAQALNTTTTAYTKASLLFYQQGLDDQTVADRTAVVMKMANVTKDAATDVSSYMTAIWNNFDDGSTSLERYADVITALGASTASSSAEIAAGLEKFASIGKTIGLSYDYATSALATIVANTRQSADTVGTGLRTIFSRLQGLKLGETLEDGVDLNKYSAALAAVGVNILDATGNLKNMDTILEDLASKWDTLGQAQQNALAQTVGGVRQYTTLIALMSNWDDMQKNLQTASNAEGTLQQQADIYAESWKASADRVKNALQGIYDMLIDDKAFISMLDGVEKVVGGIQGLIKAMGGLPGVLSGIGVLITKVFGKDMAAGIDRSLANLKMILTQGKQVIAQKTAANSILETIVRDDKNANSGTSIRADNYRQQAEAQNLMLANASKLSAEEQQVAAILLDQVRARQEAVEAAAQEVEKTEAQASKAEGIVQSLFNSIKTQSGQQGITIPVEVTNAEKALATFQNLQTIVEGVTPSATAIGAALDSSFATPQEKIAAVTTEVNDLEERLKSLKDVPQEVTTAFIELQNAIKSGDLGEITKKYNDFNAALAQVETSAANAGQKILTSLQSIDMSAMPQELQTMYTTLIQKVQEYMAAETAKNAAVYEADIAQRQAASAMEIYKKALENAKGAAQTFGQSIVTAFRGISSLLMGINSLQSAFESLNDPDISGWEKFKKVMLSLSMGIPMVVSGLTSLKAAHLGGAAAGALQAAGLWLQAAAQTGLTTAIGGTTAAQWLLNAAMDANPIGLAITAVVALTAALAALTVGMIAWVNAANQPSEAEKKLAAAKKEADNLKSALGNTKTEYDNLKSDINKYDSITDSLSKCTAGTQEWYNKTLELNELINELLITYPELAGYAGNIEEGIEHLREIGKATYQGTQIATLVADSNANIINAENTAVSMTERADEYNTGTGLRYWQDYDSALTYAQLFKNGKIDPKYMPSFFVPAELYTDSEGTERIAFSDENLANMWSLLSQITDNNGNLLIKNPENGQLIYNTGASLYANSLANPLTFNWQGGGEENNPLSWFTDINDYQAMLGLREDGNYIPYENWNAFIDAMGKDYYWHRDDEPEFQNNEEDQAAKAFFDYINSSFFNYMSQMMGVNGFDTLSLFAVPESFIQDKGVQAGQGYTKDYQEARSGGQAYTDQMLSDIIRIAYPTINESEEYIAKTAAVAMLDAYKNSTTYSSMSPEDLIEAYGQGTKFVSEKNGVITYKTASGAETTIDTTALRSTLAWRDILLDEASAQTYYTQAQNTLAGIKDDPLMQHFVSNRNLDTMTFGAIKSISTDNDDQVNMTEAEAWLRNAFGIPNEVDLNNLAHSLGYYGENAVDTMLQAFVDGANNALSATDTNMAKLSSSISDTSKSAIHDLLTQNEMTLQGQNDLISLINNTNATAGATGVDRLLSVLSSPDILNGNSLPDVITAFNTIDWSKMHGVEDVTAALSEQNIELDATSEAWKNYCEYLIQVNKGAEQVISSAAKMNLAVNSNGTKAGTKIEGEDYAKLQAAGFDLSQYVMQTGTDEFTFVKDWTIDLTALVKQSETAHKTLQDTADGFKKINQESSDFASTFKTFLNGNETLLSVLGIDKTTLKENADNAEWLLGIYQKLQGLYTADAGYDSNLMKSMLYGAAKNENELLAMAKALGDIDNSVTSLENVQLDNTSPLGMALLYLRNTAEDTKTSFTGLITTIGQLAGTLGSLDFGKTVSGDVYKQLMDFAGNEAPSGFKSGFIKQSDGSYRYIGKKSDVNTVLENGLIEQINNINTMNKLPSSLDNFYTKDNIIADPTTYAKWAKSTGNPAFRTAISAAGYTIDEAVSILNGNNADDIAAFGQAIEDAFDLNLTDAQQQLASLATTMEQLTDWKNKEYINDDQVKKQASYLASQATTLKELQTFLQSDGTNGVLDPTDPGYTAGLLNIANGYKSCSDAAQEYLNALGTENEGAKRQALEDAIALEDLAAEYNTTVEAIEAYKTAVGGNITDTEAAQALKLANAIKTLSTNYSKFVELGKNTKFQNVSDIFKKGSIDDINNFISAMEAFKTISGNDNLTQANILSLLQSMGDEETFSNKWLEIMGLNKGDNGYQDAIDLASRMWSLMSPEEKPQENKYISEQLAIYENELADLEKTATKAKTAVDGLKNALGSTNNLSATTLKSLKDAGILNNNNKDDFNKWGSLTSERQLQLYGSALGESAEAQIEAIKKKKVTLTDIFEFDSNSKKYILKSAIGDMTDDLASLTQENFTKKMQDAGISGAMLDWIQTARQKAINEGKNFTWADVLSGLQTYNGELDGEIAGIWATFKDEGVAAVQTVLNKEKEAAAETVNAWLSAFKTISEARQALAEGKSIGSALGSPESWRDFILAGLEAGYGLDNITTLLSTNPSTYSAAQTEMYNAIDQRMSGNIPTAEYMRSQGGTGQFLYDANGTRAATAQAQATNAMNAITNDLNSFLNNLTEEQKAEYETQKQANPDFDDTSYIMSALGFQKGADGQWTNSNFNLDLATAEGYARYYNTSEGQSQLTAAQTAFNTVYNDQNSAISDWKAIGEAIALGQTKGTSTYQELADAEAIMARLGLTQDELNSLTISDVTESISNAQVAISNAQIAFGESAAQLLTNHPELSTQIADAREDVDEKTATNKNAVPELIESTALTYAEDAGFSSKEEQEEYIRLAVERNEIASAEEMIEQGICETKEEALELQREYANQLRKCERGLKSLADNGKKWVKTLKDGTGSLEDQVEASIGLRKGYKDILGLTDEQAKALSKNFLQNEKNLELVTTAAENAGEKGQKALDELQSRAAEDILKKNFGEVRAELDGLADDISKLNFDAGDVITGTDEAYTTLHNFWGSIVDDAMASGKSFEEATAIANDAMNALGYGVEPMAFETVEMDAEGLIKHISTSPVPVTVLGEDGQPHEITIDQVKEDVQNGGGTTYSVQVPAPKNGSAPAKFTKRAEKPGGGGGGRGGGGGGRGRDPRRANKINKKDNIERYHEIDNVIDDLADAYKRLNKEEERAWGKNRINAMQQETKILKDQIAAVEEKIRQAREWKDKDLSAALSAGWTFDANGNVNNYDEFLSSQIDKYNAAIDSYNNMSADAQEELDKKYKDMTNKDGEYYSSYEDYLKKTLIDDPKEALEQYEETMELLEDLGIEYDDFLNEWHDNIIGQIQTKLDTTLEITKDQLDYLEHKLGRIEDDAYSAAEAIGLMSQQMDIAQTQFNAQKSALDDLLKAYSPEGTVWSVEDLMNGNISIKDLVNAGMQSEDIKLIQTIMEGLMDASEQMSEQMSSSIEHMANVFEEFNSDMDRYISTVEHAQIITSTYRNIIDLTGRTMSKFNSTMLKSINDAIAAQSVANLEANKTKYETVKTQYDEAKAAYEAAQTSYAEGGIDAAALKAAKDTYQAAQDNMNEAQEAFLSSWEEALQAAADAFQSNMEAAVRDIGEIMSGGLAGGLAELEDAFAKMNEQDQNYVDDYEKIYQLTKMTRDLNDKIDSTSNVRAQKELLKYQKELNGLLESDQEMSSYDLDYLQKKLDLKLAEIALDEAQNAKSQVTMRRDSEGNYNYVYTADENAVEKAESEYANKLYEMQKANDEYITSLSENMANLSSQMLSEIAAIDTTIYDTEEKYQAEVQRITDHYTTQMEYYNSEMNKVLDNNKTLYEQDWTNFNKYTGYKISAEENYVTRWNQTVLSQVTGFETQEEFYENFNKAVFGEDPAHPSGESLIGRLVTAYKSMRDQITAANAAAGVETEDLATALLGNIEAATQEAEAAADGITDAAIEIVSQITSIGDAVTDMVNNYSQAMATMEAETDAMLGVLLDFLTAYGEIGDLNVEPGVLAEIEARRRERQENPEGFDTGGYTGAWGSEGRLAYLHQKELVLNAEDTVNMLTSVGILRQIASIIDLNALASAGGFISLMSSGVGGNQGTLQQEVHIEASFPAVTDKNQIEEAFGDLVNLAAQYANRRV